MDEIVNSKMYSLSTMVISKAINMSNVNLIVIYCSNNVSTLKFIVN